MDERLNSKVTQPIINLPYMADVRFQLWYVILRVLAALKYLPLIVLIEGRGEGDERG